MDGNRFEIKGIHAGTTDDAHGAVVAPASANSPSEHGSPMKARGEYWSARLDAPAIDDLESLLAPPGNALADAID